MSAEPVRYEETDGSVYAAEIVPPDASREPYRVDLLRASVDDHGRTREQRLTVGEYKTWGEAEEHLYEIEDGLAEDGLVALGDNAQRLREQPYNEDVVYLAVTYPPDELADPGVAAAHLLAVTRSGVDSAELAVGERSRVDSAVDRLDYILATGEVDTALAATAARFDPDDTTVRHVDSSGTVHWFQIVERSEAHDEPYELRYFRSLSMDEELRREDSFPVMPLLDDDSASAWPLPALEMYLQKGDVHMVQRLAYDVAEVYGQDFPDPLTLPALNPQPEYYFGFGVGPNNEPSLEAVKTWMDGVERHFDTLTIGEYGSFDQAGSDEGELDTLMDTKGLEAAMNLAESLAEANGYLDPTRNDPRIFFEDDAPADLFMTNRQRDMAQDPAVAGDSFAPQEQPESVAHTYANAAWKLERLPVNDPDGEPLGHALHMLVYPDLEQNPEQIASDEEPFRMLEMAHFETIDAADRFVEEFNGYLMPDVLEGPELAVEVARLEGLPIHWRALEGDELQAYRSSELLLIRDPVEWHPYNLDAERNAQIGLEGGNTDPNLDSTDSQMKDIGW